MSVTQQPLHAPVPEADDAPPGKAGWVNFLIFLSVAAFLAMFATISYFSWIHVYDRTTAVLVSGEAAYGRLRVTIEGDGTDSPLVAELLPPDYTCSFYVSEGYYTIRVQPPGRNDSFPLRANAHLQPFLVYPLDLKDEKHFKDWWAGLSGSPETPPDRANRASTESGQTPPASH